MERLRRDIHFQPVGFDLLDDEFTIPDLQRLYEAILGVKFDRRNFQRKILASGILEEAEPREGRYESEDSLMSLREEETDSGGFAKHLDFFIDQDVPAPTSASVEPRPRKGRPGRIGSLFRLNRKRYEQMKEDGGKLEF